MRGLLVFASGGQKRSVVASAATRFEQLTLHGGHADRCIDEAFARAEIAEATRGVLEHRQRIGGPVAHRLEIAEIHVDLRNAERVARGLELDARAPELGDRIVDARFL